MAGPVLDTAMDLTRLFCRLRVQFWVVARSVAQVARSVAQFGSEYMLFSISIFEDDSLVDNNIDHDHDGRPSGSQANNKKGRQEEVKLPSTVHEGKKRRKGGRSRGCRKKTKAAASRRGGGLGRH